MACQVFGRIEDVEHTHSHDHESAVKHTKVHLVSDEIAGPALRELNGPVEVPDHDAERREGGSKDQDPGVRQRSCHTCEIEPEHTQDTHRKLILS